jgi:hypothetical protein
VKQGSEEKTDFLALGELNLALQKWKDATSALVKVQRKWPYEIKALEGLAKAYKAMQYQENAAQSEYQLELLNTLCK